MTVKNCKNIKSLTSRLMDGYKRNKMYVDVPYNKFILSVTRLLFREGYIAFYEIFNVGVTIRVFLKKIFISSKGLKNFFSAKGGERTLFKVYKPFRKLLFNPTSPKFKYYVSFHKLQQLYLSNSIRYIVSTSLGLLFAEDAVKLKIGGRIIMRVVL